MSGFPMPRCRPDVPLSADIVDLIGKLARLDAKVYLVMDALIADLGFTTYASYVARMSRGRFSEIHVVLPPELKLENAAQFDSYREEILAGLGGSSPMLWLTVAFTADPHWI
jgi:predicted Co/Zn/Cd cation transporter (cation efflux family)